MFLLYTEGMMPALTLLNPPTGTEVYAFRFLNPTHLYATLRKRH